MGADLQEEFDRFIQTAKVQSAMSLESFVNPATEDSFTHSILTDDEILEVVQRIDEDEDQEEAEINIPFPLLDLPTKEKVLVLAQIIAFVENAPDGGTERQQTVGYLQRMQREFRREMAQEEQEKLKQRSITDFFNRRD